MSVAARWCFLALLTPPTSALPAQSTHNPAHHRGPRDTAFTAMQARGMQAMNVDQAHSTHRFTSRPDGGQIELTSNLADTAAVDGIRRHFAEIRKAFSSGDFSTPAFVHAREVPGTAVMAAKAGVIEYQVRNTPRGARLRITTRDPEARAAIHQFLAFQRTEHHAGQ